MNANGQSDTRRDGLWLYAILPAVLVNLVSCIIFGVYGMLLGTQPERAAGISMTQLIFWLLLFVFVLEWVLAISVILRLRRQGTPLREVIAPGGNLLGFRWGPALLIFFAFNALWAAYFGVLSTVGMPISHEGLAPWQLVFYVALFPIQAGFCEELIWRGTIITRLEARGHKQWPTILLAALSFALIHGIFLPDKLLVTFLIGIMTGLYYVRERNLLPLMVTHVVVDVWAFAVSAMGIL